MTRLDKPLKRELRIKNQPHVLTIDADGLKLTKKGRRSQRCRGRLIAGSRRSLPARQYR